MGRNKLKKHLCPICGEYYFVELSQEEIEAGEKMKDDFCTVCGWHYVEEQEKNHTLVTEINKMSFDDYKKWYNNKIKENPNYNYLEENSPADEPHMCPICGKYEFHDELSYDICPYCGWEDNGFDDINHRDEPFNIYGKTFNQYKKEYEKMIRDDPNYKWKK